MELGNKIVAELGVDDSNDTLARWMSHHVAGLLAEAAGATGRKSRSASEQCFRAVLDLWKHRSSWPERFRPFHDFEALFQTLESLDCRKATPRYFRGAPTDAESIEDHSASLRWLEAAKVLDQAARVLIRSYAVLASRDAADGAREWIRVAAGLQERRSYDVRIVRFVTDDADLLAKMPVEDQERERLLRAIEILDAFSESARGVREMLGALVAPASRETPPTRSTPSRGKGKGPAGPRRRTASRTR